MTAIFWVFINIEDVKYKNFPRKFPLIVALKWSNKYSELSLIVTGTRLPFVMYFGHINSQLLNDVMDSWASCILI